VPFRVEISNEASGRIEVVVESFESGVEVPAGALELP